MRKHHLAAFFLTLLAGLTGARNTEASTAALSSFTNGTLSVFANDLGGYRFTVGSLPILVSSLGFFDEGANGLGEAHPVGIYDYVTEMPMVSATVSGGVSATLENGFRYVIVNPTILEANTTYVILGYRAMAVDAIRFDVEELTFAPFITYDTEVGADFTGGLIFIGEPYGGVTNGWFGPNFKADVVPEPASPVIWLLGSGLLLAFWKWRKG